MVTENRRWEGHLEAVRELCERGANVNAAKTSDGFTALMMASWKGHEVVVPALLEHGASKTAVDTSGKTAYDYATGDNSAALRVILKP